LERTGYVVEDTLDGTRVRPKTPWEKRQEVWSTVSSSAEVPSLIDEDSQVGITVGVVACNYMEDVKRCVGSVRRWMGDRSAELLLVDNGSTDGTGEWMEAEAASDDSIRVMHTDHVLGEAAAKNVVLKQSRGDTVVLLDTSVEITGDVFGRIDEMLADDTVGVVGPFGLRTSDLHHFDEGEGEPGDMDAMQAYCFAFRRARLRRAGLMREGFRFYRNLDLDYSFQFKDAGYRIVADPDLPVRLHEHRVWSELAEGERDEMSRKNFRRFLEKWGHHQDLLVSNQ
jgi:cysteinyl-tRNA synthetase